MTREDQLFDQDTGDASQHVHASAAPSSSSTPSGSRSPNQAMDLSGANSSTESAMRVLSDTRDVVMLDDGNDVGDGSRDKDKQLDAVDLTLHIDTGLNLQTSISDREKLLVAEESSKQEDKRTSEQITMLRSQIERMTEENHRLRSTLNQVDDNHDDALQSNLLPILQHAQECIRCLQEKLKEVVNEQTEPARPFSEREPRPATDVAGTTTPEGGSRSPRDHDQVVPEGNPLDSKNRSDGGDGDRHHRPGKELLDESNKRDRVTAGITSAGEDIIHDRDRWLFQGLGAPGLNLNTDKMPWPSSYMELREQDISKFNKEMQKKLKVKIRARSEEPVVDGCRWRKYGQNMTKGNPCLRTQYNCCMAAFCPVRKRVQRCSEDKTVQVTTYEGVHNHPLPPQAMEVASTTLSAATLLLAEPMQRSADGSMINYQNNLSQISLHGLPGVATISTSDPYTVIADFTTNKYPPPNTISLPSQFSSSALLNGQQQQQGGVGTNLGATQFGMPSPMAGGGFALQQYSGQMNAYAAAGVGGIGQGMGTGAIQNLAVSDFISLVKAAFAADPSLTAALAEAISSEPGNKDYHNNEGGGGDTDGDTHATS